jgi:hypothetical protein
VKPAPLLPMARALPTAAAWRPASSDKPPITRTPVAAASLLGKRSDRVQALPAAMLAGPAKRIRAWAPTTAMTVLQACKAVCALDPVVSGKDGRAAAAAGCGFTSELKLEVLQQGNHQPCRRSAGPCLGSRDQHEISPPLALKKSRSTSSRGPAR